MIRLRKEGLSVDLCEPWSYYKGVRFDHGGVFRRIVKDGFVFADEWFDHADPFRHDRVCGLSEEFRGDVFDGVAPGDLFCKIGVGLLVRPDEEPYSFIRTYEIARKGKWSVDTSPERAVFTHILPGWYHYQKCIALTGPDSLSIAHTLRWEGEKPLNGWCYNHHFLTFGGAPVGPSRSFHFPWRPAGTWRSAYSNVRFTDSGIVFSAAVERDNSVFCGDLHPAAGRMLYPFEVREGGRSVEIGGDILPEFSVFWSNPRVACLEPYIPLAAATGETLSWRQDYRFR